MRTESKKLIREENKEKTIKPQDTQQDIQLQDKIGEEYELEEDVFFGEENPKPEDCA